MVPRIGLTIISIALLLIGTYLCISGQLASGYYAPKWGASVTHRVLSGYEVLFYGVLVGGMRLWLYSVDKKMEREQKEEEARPKKRRAPRKKS